MVKMKLYTSYYGNLRNLPPDMVKVNIAGKTPNWFLGDRYPLHVSYRQLAPLYLWWKEWHGKFGENPDSIESVEWYTRKYYDTVLSQLDPLKVYGQLADISGNMDACLLCYETPDKFCHRHLVSAWLRDSGIECNEYGKL